MSSGPIPAVEAAASVSTGRFAHMARALRHRNFRLYLSGQVVSLMGSWMTRLALSWLTYRLTHSALLLGMVGFAARRRVTTVTA